MTLSSQNKNPKQIILNAFDMNSVGHINHGLWTHPRDESHRFNELSYWTDLAQTLEQGLFDGLFIADITGVYDVYQNGLDLTLKESIQLPSHDPSTLVSAMAAVTQHLGWEGSWEDDAVQKDKLNRVFTDPSKVHAIQHEGKFFQSQGIFQVSPSIQRTPVLYQAGASSKGLAFATQHAEAMFIGADTPEKLKQQVDKIRVLALRHGRDEQAIKLFVGISVVTAETDELAQEKLAEYIRYASPEAGLAHFSSSVGIDLAQFADDEAIPYKQTNSIASVNNKFKEQKVTRADLKAQHVLGGRYPLIVGSGKTVAEKLIQLIDETGVDGFNLTRTVAPESHQDFIGWVIPELQERGRYKTAYETGSLRHKLFAQGDRLTATPPVQQYRCQSSCSHPKTPQKQTA